MSPTRRRYLALAAASLAGCLDRPAGPPDDDATDRPPDDTPTASPTPTAPPARPAVRSLSAPDSVRVGERFTVSATVANVGGQPDAFGLPVALDRGDGEWHRRGTLRTDTLAPGEAATVETDALAAELLPTLRVRVGDGLAGTRLAVEPAIRSFGDPFRTREGVRVTVDGVEFADAYEHHVDGRVRVERAGPGRQWALVPVETHNPTDTPAAAPRYGEFALVERVSDRQTDPVRYRAAGAYRGGVLLGGAQRDGRVLFSVSAARERADLAVAWTRQYGEAGAATAYWRPSTA